MSDKIDTMFASDMEKLNQPSELVLNAAKVKAAQDPTKPGAEKPDLGAPGKKTEKKASDCSGNAKKLLAKVRDKKKVEKKASIDEDFRRDLSQMVGIEIEAESDWQRPDVGVEGQATDLIDDNYLAWMNDKAQEDVVKVAASITSATKKAQTLGGKLGKKFPGVKKTMGKAEGFARKAVKHTKKNPAAAIGAGATGLAAGAILGRLTKRAPAPAPETGVKTPDGQVKQAGVVENQENLDLMAKIRKAAGDKFGSNSSDV